MPNEFQASGTRTQPERFVITDAESLENLHPDGAWIATDKPARVKQ